MASAEVSICVVVRTGLSAKGVDVAVGRMETDGGTVAMAVATGSSWVRTVAVGATVVGGPAAAFDAGTDSAPQAGNNQSILVTTSHTCHNFDSFNLLLSPVIDSVDTKRHQRLSAYLPPNYPDGAQLGRKVTGAGTHGQPLTGNWIIETNGNVVVTRNSIRRQ